MPDNDNVVNTNIGVPIGLSMLHYALLTKDDASGVAYETPKRLYGAVSASINPNSETSSFFADDGPYESSTTLGQIELTVSVANVPLEIKGEMLGHTVNGGVMVSKSTDQAPWLAIGYRVLKSNGKYTYKWLFKGKAAESTDESETKGDTINYQPKEITFAFVKRDFDDAWQKEADEDAEGFTDTIKDAWFTDVEGALPKMMSLTGGRVVFIPNPTDGGTSFAVDAAPTVTSNTELDKRTVNSNNVFITTADGTPISSTVTLDPTRKVITITPNANLTATTKYLLVVTNGVKTIFGQSLGTPSITDFTTA